MWWKFTKAVMGVQVWANAAAVLTTFARAKEFLEVEYGPAGCNIGMNCGAAAGQTVPHFHCHLIPRSPGDMADPRGGMRQCIADKSYYSARQPTYAFFPFVSSMTPLLLLLWLGWPTPAPNQASPPRAA